MCRKVLPWPSLTSLHQKNRSEPQWPQSEIHSDSRCSPQIVHWSSMCSSNFTLVFFISHPGPPCTYPIHSDLQFAPNFILAINTPYSVFSVRFVFPSSFQSLKFMFLPLFLNLIFNILKFTLFFNLHVSSILVFSPHHKFHLTFLHTPLSFFAMISYVFFFNLSPLHFNTAFDHHIPFLPSFIFIFFNFGEIFFYLWFSWFSYLSFALISSLYSHHFLFLQYLII